MIGTAAIASILTGTAIALPAVAKQSKNIKPEEALCRTGLRVLTEEERSLTAMSLTRAGSSMKPEYFQGLKVFITGIYLLFVMFVSLFFAPGIGVILLLLLIAPIVWLLPSAKLKGMIEKRQGEAKYKLDDFATYLSTALESVDMLTALQEASEATGGVYGIEINQVIKENASGKSLSDALHDWAHRMNLPEVNSLVTTLNQIYLQGSPAAEKMTEYAERMRITKKHEIWEASGKASNKLIFVAAGFMLLPVFLVIGYPTVVTLLQAF